MNCSWCDIDMRHKNCPRSEVHRICKHCLHDHEYIYSIREELYGENGIVDFEKHFQTIDSLKDYLLGDLAIIISKYNVYSWAEKQKHRIYRVNKLIQHPIKKVYYAERIQ